MILKVTFFFPFPFSNYDATRHIKNITREFFIIFLMLKNALKIIVVFGIKTIHNIIN